MRVSASASGGENEEEAKEEGEANAAATQTLVLPEGRFGLSVQQQRARLERAADTGRVLLRKTILTTNESGEFSSGRFLGTSTSSPTRARAGCIVIYACWSRSSPAPITYFQDNSTDFSKKNER